MKPLKIGIVGLGQAARNIHIPALGNLAEKFRIVGACDPDPAAREEARTLLPGAEMCNDFEELLASSEVEALDIVSPPDLHAEQACRALAGGVEVFCEKPLASSLSDADGMLLAADESGRSLVVNGQFPDMAIHRAAKQEIESPRFGRLLFLQAAQAFRTTEETEAGWRKDAPRRVIFDFGVHLFDLSAFFFGELPAGISCSISSLETEVAEAAVTIALEFPSGGAASFVLNRVSSGEQRYCDVALTGPDAEVRCAIGGRADLAVGIAPHSHMPYARTRFARGGTAERVQAGRSTLIAKEGPNPFAAATEVRLSAFFHQVRRRTAAPRSAAHHREVLALALAAYESAESGRRIDMTDRYAPTSGLCR